MHRPDRVKPIQLTVADLRVGVPVEYLGKEPDCEGVWTEALTSRGIALFPGHPGRILPSVPQHVQVSWVGLEEEAASHLVGFDSDTVAPEGIYRGLGVLSEREFARREKIMTDALNSGVPLSGWVPGGLARPTGSAWPGAHAGRVSGRSHRAGRPIRWQLSRLAVTYVAAAQRPRP
jgi:hypothetical protein